MTHKLLLRINIQSFSDIVTNSSSEIFCQIRSKDAHGIQVIAEYLNSILPMTVTPTECYEDEDYGEDAHVIDFWCEMGAFNDYETIPDVFAVLLRETLNQHFREGIDYTIETNIPM